MKIDFHSHTTASDGTFTPTEIIKEAVHKQLEYYAITDHDTLDGVKQIKEIPEGMVFVTGVEISAEYQKILHILGYGFDLENKNLNAKLDELQTYRKKRNKNMLIKMENLGFHITMEELIEEAGSDLVGRPHFANLMLRKGYVESYQEAFDRYLKKGASLYLNKKRLDPEEAIKLIHEAGGIAVMAHPYQTKKEGKELEALVKQLKKYGLDGIEVYYSQHTPEMIEEYNHYAQKYELIKTAGSDFHGTNKPHISLGMEVEKKEIEAFLSFVDLKRL